jgi:hypothetical protein
MRTLRLFCFALFVSLCASLPAAAWTVTGHTLVVEIATRYLSERAIGRLRELLGRDPNELADLSTWADDIIRERPETEPWHTVEIPHDSDGYVRERDCLYGNCIVEKINEFERMLIERLGSQSQQAEAVKFLIHLVGDIHVPMHAYAPGPPHDPWANWESWEGPWLRIGNLTRELHNWWDWYLIARLGPQRRVILDKLLSEMTAGDLAAWRSGTPADWANESFQTARAFVVKYGLRNPVGQQGRTESDPIVLDSTAADEGTTAVSQRLKMAGVRLAWLLNRALN